MHDLIYLTCLIVFTIGLYITISSDNYLRKIIGLGALQSSILIFFVSLGKVDGGTLPVYPALGANNKASMLYSSPLPHVLMLTAIVVGFTTFALGLALIKQIQQKFGSISEVEVQNITVNSKYDHS